MNLLTEVILQAVAFLGVAVEALYLVNTTGLGLVWTLVVIGSGSTLPEGKLVQGAK